MKRVQRDERDAANPTRQETKKKDSGANTHEKSSKKLSDQEKWEMKQLVQSGVLNATDFVDDEQEDHGYVYYDVYCDV